MCKVDPAFNNISKAKLASCLSAKSKLVKVLIKADQIHSNKDKTMVSSPGVKEWVELVNEGSSKFGKVLDMGPKLKDLMRTAGFVDIQERVVQIPCGPWAKGQKAKEMGVYQREHLCECVDAFTLALFTRVLGWTLEDTQALMAKCKKGKPTVAPDPSNLTLRVAMAHADLVKSFVILRISYMSIFGLYMEDDHRIDNRYVCGMSVLLVFFGSRQRKHHSSLASTAAMLLGMVVSTKVTMPF